MLRASNGRSICRSRWGRSRGHRRSALSALLLAGVSSAAFLVAAAVLAEAGELIIENVGVNPTRTGFIVVLERMGAHVERVNLRDEGGEPVADLVVRPAQLRGTEVPAAEIPTLCSEIPNSSGPGR